MVKLWQQCQKQKFEMQNGMLTKQKRLKLTQLCNATAGSRIPGFHGSMFPRFQRSLLPWLQGSKVPATQGSGCVLASGPGKKNSAPGSKSKIRLRCWSTGYRCAIFVSYRLRGRQQGKTWEHITEGENKNKAQMLVNWLQVCHSCVIPSLGSAAG